MLRTTDAGITWNEVFIGTHQNQNTVYFFDESNGFLIGNAGMLLRTSNGGFTDAQEPVKFKPATDEFTVFPNPATDRITISSALTGTQQAKVFVSTPDGRKLIEQNLPAGKEQPVLDISKLSAGIYICSIVNSNTIVSTKFVKIY